MTKIIKNRFINILFTVFYFVTGIYIFPAKITDYVNKEDAKRQIKYLYIKITEKI